MAFLIDNLQYYLQVQCYSLVAVPACVLSRLVQVDVVDSQYHVLQVVYPHWHFRCLQFCCTFKKRIAEASDFDSIRHAHTAYLVINIIMDMLFASSVCLMHSDARLH
jgi:hypothetical protein